MKRFQVRRLNSKVPKMSIGGIVGNTVSMGAAGSTFGPVGTVAGAAVGLVTGIMDHKKEKEAEQEQRRLENMQTARLANKRQAGRLNQYNQSINQGGMEWYGAKGGSPKASNKAPWYDYGLQLGKYGGSITPKTIGQSFLYAPEGFNHTVSGIIDLALGTGYSPFSKKHWGQIGGKFRKGLLPTQDELTEATSNSGRIIGNTANAAATLATKGGAKIVGRGMEMSKGPVKQAAGKLMQGKFEPGWVNPSFSGIKNVGRNIGRRATKTKDLLREATGGASRSTGTPRGVDLMKTIPPRPRPAPAMGITPTPMQTGLPNVNRAMPRGSRGNRHIGDYVNFSMGGSPMGEQGQGTIVKDANIIPIAPGATQVKANKKGKDTIPANIDGTPAYIDNNELIIDSPQFGSVVVSDDLGEVTKYKELLARGYKPEKLNDVFAKRAILHQQANEGSTNNLVDGGQPHSFINYPPSGMVEPTSPPPPVGQIQRIQLPEVTVRPPFIDYQQDQTQYQTQGIYNPEDRRGQQLPIMNNIEGQNQSNMQSTGRLTEPPNIRRSEGRAYDPIIGREEWKMDSNMPVPPQARTNSNLGLYGGVTPDGIINNMDPAILSGAFGDNIPSSDNWSMDNTRALTNYINTNYADQLKNVDNKFGHDYYQVMSRPKVDRPSINDPGQPSTITAPKSKMTMPESVVQEADRTTEVSKQPFDMNKVLAAGSIASDVISAFESKNVRRPQVRYDHPILEQHNPTPFTRERNAVRAQAGTTGRMVREGATSSGTVANRLSNIHSVTANRLGQSRAAESGAITDVNNRNVRAMNIAGDRNTQIMNQQEMFRYGADQQDVARTHGMTQNAIRTAQSFLDRIEAKEMDDKALRAIAESYGLQLPKNASIEDIRKLSLEQLSTYINPK